MATSTAKTKSTALAKTATPPPTPASAAPAPALLEMTTTDTTADALLQQLQSKLASVQAAKDANATKGRELDEKLKRAFKTPPKRPNASAAQIDTAMNELEMRRTTVSMSLSDEKHILRELQMLQERKNQVLEFERFQKWVDAAKQERNERFIQHRSLDEQLSQLKAAMRKVSLAQSIGASMDDFVTLEITSPEDRMGSVVGKNFANAKRIETACGVVLETESKSTLIRICGPKANAAQAKRAIENITMATTHTIGLHPDAIKLLVAQKGKMLQELEQKFHVKIDIHKVDGVLSVLASPDVAAELEKIISGLTEGSKEIQLPPEIVPKLIGKKGEVIHQLMEDTGCLVDIDKVTNAVRLCGARESVAMATRFVKDLIEQQSQREQVLSVADDRDVFGTMTEFQFEFFVEFLMSNKAQQLKILRTDAGDARVQIQRDAHAIQVIGNKSQLESMAEALRERIREFDAHHWLYQVSDVHVLSLIIGKKGQQIKELESQGKDAHVRVEIRGQRVCVLGDTPAAIEATKAKILEIVDQNQRSPYLTSQHVVALLLSDKRAKLNEIETSSGCRVHLPPPPSAAPGSAGAGKSNRRIDLNDDQVKIVLVGSFDAIAEATSQLDALDEAHHVRYVPLDDDEVPTVIGKKGETISELEKKSGAKLRVLRNDAATELEMLGTDEQLTSAQAAIDVLLQTSNRRILELDGFSAGCLIGKKGERIHAIRDKHPDATIDAFPTRGQVRVKAASPEALQACIEEVQRTLRETIVVESVRVHKTTTGALNFNAVLKKHTAISAKLHELEAEGGEQTKVTFQEEGRVAKIRGPVLAVGKLKKFLEMLVTPDAAFVELIALPTMALASALLVKGETEGSKLNDNAARICKQTGCAIRVKKSSGSTSSAPGVIRIEGTDATSVFEAKHQVETLLEFYNEGCFRTLDKLPEAVIPRLYDLLPELAGQHSVVFSLLSRSSLRIFADNKATIAATVSRIEKELANWENQHVQVTIPGWLVPVLVGKNGETIKKLSAETPTARLDLGTSGSNASSPSSRATRGKFEAAEPRTLTISASDEATTQQALENVQQFLRSHESRTSSVQVPAHLLDLAVSTRKDAPSGIQFYVVATSKDDSSEAQSSVVLYGGDIEAREALVERIEAMVESSIVDTLVLPPTAGKGVVGALIGKGGANIKTLQQEFPRVSIDIRKDDNVVKFTGPSTDVVQVKRIMEDKVVELVQQEEAFQQQRKPRFVENNENDRGETSAARHAEPVSDENNAPPNQNSTPSTPSSGAGLARQQQRLVPVGSSADTSQLKLSKNQRRRMRKRAENEKKSDVLRMLVGASPVMETNSARTQTPTPTDDDSGYYHSTSGYSLRL